MPSFLQGLKLSFYRGIGATEQAMSDFKDFNFFIGANNSGKSSVLHFINSHLSRYNSHKYKAIAVDSLERHVAETTGTLKAEIAIRKDVLLDKLESKISLSKIAHFRSRASTLGRQIINKLSDGTFVWIVIPIPFTNSDQRQNKFSFGEEITLNNINQNEREEWNVFWQCLYEGRSGGGFANHWFPESLSAIIGLVEFRLPEVGLIPAIREIGAKGQQYNDFSGRGLIDILAEFQNPEYENLANRTIFDSINQFLKSVTGENSATIQIPHNRDQILININEKILPLTVLGTGIHEVVMLAAFCTICRDMILCIEEPEIHLHPILQRKFINYLSRNTNNQYFIATHSATFIDTPGAAIFRVSNDHVETRITETILRKDQYTITTDLGYKASDILQTNCVVWVEGPSDRIYINHWIRARNGELTEGVHYSVMFYGGRLLSHLSFDEDQEEISEFVNLIALNRKSAIVIDSDKSEISEEINQTKRRIVEEVTTAGGFAWVTAGREIENYINYEALQAAVKKAHPRIYGSSIEAGQFSHSLYFNKKREIGKAQGADGLVHDDVSKVKVARLVCAKAADLETLDLSTQVDGLINFITQANL